MPNYCGHCNKTVYAVEEVKVSTGYYHKSCFRCPLCKTSLTKGKEAVHEGNIYCQTCYNKNFRPKGYGYGTSNLASYQEAPKSGGNFCNGCGKPRTGGAKFCANCGTAY